MSTVSADRLRWIGVDWGTTRVRAWAMGEGDAPLEAAVADAGMGTLRPEDYEPTLLGLVAPWLGHDAALVPTLVCGMAGARQGWREAPYAAVPGAPLAIGSVARPPLRDRRLSVAILPGLAQCDPPDVMRGEETQIAGALASGADPDGVLCLPGTHTKWARLEGGRVAAFATGDDGGAVRRPRPATPSSATRSRTTRGTRRASPGRCARRSIDRRPCSPRCSRCAPDRCSTRARRGRAGRCSRGC